MPAGAFKTPMEVWLKWQPSMRRQREGYGWKLSLRAFSHFHLLWRPPVKFLFLKNSFKVYISFGKEIKCSSLENNMGKNLNMSKYLCYTEAILT